MNSKTQEECRSFREFYPDPELRQQVHYEFAHRFLPQYVHQNPYAFFSYVFRQDVPGGAMDPTRFIQSRWAGFERMAGLVERDTGGLNSMVFRRVSDLTMSKQEIAGMAVALVQMPTPEGPLNAHFVAVALLASAARPESWSRDVPARVFTLEAEYSDNPRDSQSGLFCEWTKEGEHKNFGLAVRVERDAFLRVVAAALQAPNAPTAASSTSKENGSTATIRLRSGGGSSPRSVL